MRRLRGHTIGLLFSLLLLPVVSCKTSEDAKATAAQMTTTAQQLSSYYTALAQVVDDHAKLERLQTALLGVPLDAQDQAQLKSIHDEVEKRAGVAASLSALAGAMNGLTRSSAASDASTAASDLGTALSGIAQLPGASYAPDALPPAAKMLTQLVQERDERKAAKAMEPTMNALSNLFTQERPAYDSINKTDIVLAQSLALELLKRNQLDPGSLMAPALKPFGLSSRLPTEQLPQGLSDYARQEIQDRGSANIAAQNAASQAVDSGLKEMAKRVHQLANDGHMPERGSPLNWTTIQTWIAML